MTIDQELAQAYEKLHEAETVRDRLKAVIYYIGECQAATTEGYNRRKSASKAETRRHRAICKIIADSIESERLEAPRAIIRGSLEDMKMHSVQRLREADSAPDPIKRRHDDY